MLCVLALCWKNKTFKHTSRAWVDQFKPDPWPPDCTLGPWGSFLVTHPHSAGRFLPDLCSVVMWCDVCIVWYICCAWRVQLSWVQSVHSVTKCKNWKDVFCTDAICLFFSWWAEIWFHSLILNYKTLSYRKY